MSAGICIMGYDKDNIDRVKGWDGFVSQDGIFYKVAEIDDMSDVHDVFADIFSRVKLHLDLEKVYYEYQLQNSRYEAIKFSYKDIFIHILGYANVEHKQNGLEIEPPNPRVNHFKLTDKQIVTIAELVRVNNDNIEDLNQAFQYENLEETDYGHSKKRRANW